MNGQFILAALSDGLEKVPPLQVLNWKFGIVGPFLTALALGVAIIVNREHLIEFLRLRAKVICTVLAIGGILTCCLNGWLGWLGWFSKPSGVPIWLLFLIILFAAFALALCVGVLVTVRRPQMIAPP